ncbi:hypothetical protein [Nocardioides sp.]|uniref:hypothetical protein n=1 Tax=Nocardioides sp. TaxID=35761 RepID=UPI002728FA5F|nr:hypothetical protein [Nocardioides sp.]MDO9454792.1 hypothetical protein [Nocardioides sp.]
MNPIPEDLCQRPFSRAEALDAGVTSRMLEGQRFVRVHDGVWRVRDHEMTDEDWLLAAQLALPARAHLTGISRLQQLGLDFGPRLPIRFVVEGDLHRQLENVFLHRTKKLAPRDEIGICVAAAFIAYCSLARVIDAVKVGDWLLHHGHMTLDELKALAYGARWRAGAFEALWICDYLDGDSRSLKESETRAVLEFAGLPRPKVNATVPLWETVTIIVDLFYVAFRAAVEYEGRQHFEDPIQFASDIGRYAALRRGEIAYVQATNEKLNQPRHLVLEVHQMLVTRGYDGPAPEFGDRWASLFGPLSKAVEGLRREFLLRDASGEVA